MYFSTAWSFFFSFSNSVGRLIDPPPSPLLSSLQPSDSSSLQPTTHPPSFPSQHVDRPIYRTSPYHQPPVRLFSLALALALLELGASLVLSSLRSLPLPLPLLPLLLSSVKERPSSLLEAQEELDELVPSSRLETVPALSSISSETSSAGKRQRRSRRRSQSWAGRA